MGLYSRKYTHDELEARHHAFDNNMLASLRATALPILGPGLQLHQNNIWQAVTALPIGWRQENYKRPTAVGTFLFAINQRGEIVSNEPA